MTDYNMANYIKNKANYYKPRKKPEPPKGPKCMTIEEWIKHNEIKRYSAEESSVFDERGRVKK
jgi:hypothetical protein